jgi:hypothetical protein
MGRLNNSAGKMKGSINDSVEKAKGSINKSVGKVKGGVNNSMGKVKGGIKNSVDKGIVQLPSRRMSTSMSLSAVSDIEKLAQKRGTNTLEERFKVVPDYAYPNTRLNRAELRMEMNKKSSYFHGLRLPEEKQPVGELTVEILQCFGIPKPDLLRETSAFCVLVCGNHAFKTDVMPPVANPMWLSKMRRACIFPVHNAYARLYIGVFGQSQNEKRDGFAGRIVVDISRLRPNCTYDITLPLRQSSHVYSREQRGAIRFRFHLNWNSEREAVLSYLPRKVPKIEPNESVSIPCCDAKSFQNVARVVHGNDMPGKYSMKQMKAVVREINFTRIHVLRYMRKNEVRNMIQWRYPVISGFVFFAWMHSVYKGSVTYVPGHLVTVLLLHLWKNYAYYALESTVQNGFLAPTWEEMFSALLLGTGNRKYIEPLEMEMKNEEAARSPLQDIQASMNAMSLSVIDESTASFNVPLKEIAEALRSGIKGKSLKYHFQTYHNSFRGTDAVDFLVNSGFAASREHAVVIGRRLAKELKVFQHVAGKHEFKDEPLFYVFLAYDSNEYIIKTHRPRGKSLFRMLGFLPEKDLAEAQVHLEMPYSEGVDHPRFTVKESLVIRSKESQRLLSQEMEDADAASGLLGSQSQEQLARQGLDDFLDEDKDENTKSTDFMEDEEEEEDDGVIVEIKILKKPPQQDINIKGKGGKKITDVLAEARHKVHGVLLHMFNDRVYKIDEKGATLAQPGSDKGISPSIPSQIQSPRKVSSRVESQRLTPPKSFSRDTLRSKSFSMDELKAGVDVAARKDEYNKLLGINKYSVGNPWIAKVGVIVQPIVEIALEWLCLFRALFNIFTWRDPILSFWISIIGPVLVVVLHIFPWRWVMGIVGLLVMGPQNWLLRVMREQKEDYEPFDADKIVKKKRAKKETESEREPEELPLFSMYAPDNRPVNNSDVDQSNVRKIVVPYSPLMYQRFYDWPPEYEYARVRAEDPPRSDPQAITPMESYSLRAESVDSERSRSRWFPRSLVKGMQRIRRRKKSAPV